MESIKLRKAVCCAGAVALVVAAFIGFVSSSVPAVVTPATFLTHRINGDETLMEVARRYDLGFVELRAANPGVDPWRPGAGREITIPSLHLYPQSDSVTSRTPRIVINLADMRLYLYRGAEYPVLSYPVGIGREGWETPLGETHIVRKRRDPTWIPPASIRARNNASENGLGT